MTDADRVTGAATPPGTPRPAGTSQLGAAERRGLSLPGRLVLVLLGELGTAANIWVGTRATVHVFLWLYVLLPLMLVLGILVTVQAHHRLPVPWHVVVFLGWAASLMIAPWASTWDDTQPPGGFEGAYVTGLAGFALLAIQVSCLLAVFRPAGSSYLTRSKIAQAEARQPDPREEERRPPS